MEMRLLAARVLRFLPVAAVVLLVSPLGAQISVPEIAYDSTPNFLKLPEHIYLGEAAGVATNSKGHVFVYTRTGSTNVSTGTSRTFSFSGSRLFEFDQNGNWVREIGKDLYGLDFAHVVRVDKDDNIWVVDEGANLVIKFNPEGRVVMTIGRKPEALRVPAAPAPGLVPLAAGGAGGAGGRGTAGEGRGAAAEGGAGRGAGAGGAGAAAEGRGAGGQGGPGGGGGGGRGLPGSGGEGETFNRPTDVAWDAAGNVFVSDGYGNSRVAKYDKNGKFLKTWGSRGSEPGQFNTPHTMATDTQGNVYVGDRGNRRIQVFDNNGTFKAQYINVGAPWAICITPGAHQYLYSSDSNGTGDMDNGEIYKMELDGRIVGKFGHAGKLLKEFGSIHEIDCRDENNILVGELTNWRVQKLTLHPGQATRSQ
jgi:hypothetical protein